MGQPPPPWSPQSPSSPESPQSPPPFGAPPPFDSPQPFGQSPQDQPPGYGPPPPPGYGPPPPGFGPPGQQPPGYGPPPGYGQPPPPPGKGGNNKLIWIIVAVAAGFVLLCGGGTAVAAIVLLRAAEQEVGTPPVGQPSPGPVRPAGPLEWWHSTPSDAPLATAWEESAGEFEAAGHGEIEILVVENAILEDRFAVSAAAGQAPDVFPSSGGHRLRQHVERGLVRDLTDDLADVIATLAPSTLAPYTVDGRVYGLPYSAGAVGFWYNRGLFADAGLDPDAPPVTWGEFEAAVEALSSAGIDPVTIGGQELWPIQFWFGSLATRTAGVEAIAEASRARSFLEDPGFLAAAELLDDAARSDTFHPDHPLLTYVDSASMLAGGEAAMELMGHWAPQFYQDVSGGHDADLGWFPFPVVEGGSGGSGDVYGGTEGFALSSTAPDEAVDLLRFLLSGSGYDRVIASGGLVPVTSAASLPADDPLAPVQAAVHEAPTMQVYLDLQLPPQVTGTLNELLGSLMVGAITPEAMINDLTAAYQNAPD